MSKPTNTREENIVTIVASNVQFQECPAALLFRNADYPKVDFYLDTGQWSVMGNLKLYRGGAPAFLSWYELHKVPITEDLRQPLKGY
jgi:hypothetical protein